MVERGAAPRRQRRAPPARSSPAGGRRRRPGGNPDRRPPAARRCATCRARSGGRAWRRGRLTVRSRLDRDPLDLAAGGIDPGGDVAGDDRRPAAVDRLDRRRGGLARGARRSRCRRSRRRPRRSPRARRRGRPAALVRRRARAPRPRSRSAPGAGPRPARRRRCCPCRRRSAPGPRGASSATASASAVPAASISSGAGTPCSSIAQRSTARIPSASKSGLQPGLHPSRPRARRPPRTRASGSARPRPARRRAASAARPESLTVGGSPATTSISRRPKPPREAERLDDRLLGGEAGGEMAPGPGAIGGVAALGLGEDPLGEARVALQGALQAADLQQVDADAGTAIATALLADAGDQLRRRQFAFGAGAEAEVVDLAQVGLCFAEAAVERRDQRFDQLQRGGAVDEAADRRARRERRPLPCRGESFGEAPRVPARALRSAAGRP